MPLFAVTKTTLSTVDQTNFATEKDLQTVRRAYLGSRGLDNDISM